MRSLNITIVSVLALASLAAEPANAPYDPLAVAVAGPEPTWTDFAVDDVKRSRQIPIRVYLPAHASPAPVVLFSHGLGGTREGPAYLGNHWASRGYVVVFVQHPGSDDSVWKDLPPGQRMAAMQKAAGLDNFLLRVHDVPAVLDQLESFNATAGHALFRRMDLEGVGMCGHSFGAVTTQAVSGQRPARGNGFADARIKAAVAMSPSAPRRGATAARAFGSVAIPWLLLTGTHDTALIGGADVASRLAVYAALPPGRKYELVLDGAEHSAFSDRPLPGDRNERNPNHHKAILAVTTAFWDAYLRDDAAAKQWLEGDAVRGVLERADRWQTK